MFCNIQKKCDSISQRKIGVEGPKRKINGIMGLTVETQYENAHLPGRKVNKPCREQLISDVIKGRSHQISPPMLILPPQSTLLKAIRNNQLATWPGLTAEAVEKYLPESCPATNKGNMKKC